MYSVSYNASASALIATSNIVFRPKQFLQTANVFFKKKNTQRLFSQEITDIWTHLLELFENVIGIRVFRHIVVLCEC